MPDAHEAGRAYWREERPRRAAVTRQHSAVWLPRRVYAALTDHEYCCSSALYAYWAEGSKSEAMAKHKIVSAFINSDPDHDQSSSWRWLDMAGVTV